MPIIMPNKDMQEEAMQVTECEGPSGLFPDKYSTYFASMSPLAAKVLSDIRKVEESVEDFHSLPYDEKCSIIDKRIYRDKQTDDSMDYDNHTAALLMAVYPKKPDKYVYEDNAYWVDGHSGSYTACTESQIKMCKLGALIKEISFPPQKRYSCNKKYKAPAKPLGAKPEAETTKELKHGGNGFGNPLNEELKDSVPTKNSTAIIVEPSPKSSVGCMKNSNVHLDEDNLPHQKQNSDLIAELQAKLKKSKSEGKGAPMQASSLNKIHKPRAPPPPPPQCSAEVASSGQSEKMQRFQSDKAKQKQGVSDDDFNVDISSPCRIATPKTGFDFLDNW